MTFAAALQRARARKRWTLRELAERVFVRGKARARARTRHPSLAYLNDLERGKRSAPPGYLAEQLARALGVPTLTALARGERTARWASLPPVIDETASSTATSLP